jgi:hypothetical protein
MTWLHPEVFMRLAVVLAVVMHLSVINALAQTPAFARTNYPFLGNDQITPR